MVETFQDQIEKWEHLIHAFTTLAKPIDAENERAHAGPLVGIRVGVKDIIDVIGLPTRNGSLTCRDAEPAPRDAGSVALLREAGACIVGKTTTTEFAFTDPTACRNPHDVSRSPGGSSSGSGAAVAAGLVDVALGTQTAGSLCRPAAYCGVVGFKPSYGVVPMSGVTPLAPSFDSVGIIAASVEMAQRCFEVLAPQMSMLGKSPSKCRIMSGLLDNSVAPIREMQNALEHAAEALARISPTTSQLGLSIDTQSIVANHRLVMNYEAARAHGHFLANDQKSQLQPKFLAGLQTGSATTAEQARLASEYLEHAATDFWTRIGDVDVILTLPVPDGAPLIDGTTGFQDWLTPWTVFGGPLISLPWGKDQLGRPLAVMLAGRPQQDATLLAVAAALEGFASPMPVLQLPSR